MFHSQWSKYQFLALIMGLTQSPRAFTKVHKPTSARLRSNGHVSWTSSDNSCLKVFTYHISIQNIETVLLMDSLGLTVQQPKSVFEPTQQIIPIGFLLCSVTMTARMPPERVQEIITFCTYVLLKRKVYNQKNLSTDWKVGIQTTRSFFYRSLEKVKEWDRKKHYGNNNNCMTVSKHVKQVTELWIHNVDSSNTYLMVKWNWSYTLTHQWKARGI